MSIFSGWQRRGKRSAPQLTQYVGDDTILLYGKDEVFVYVDGCDASLTPCLLRDDDWEPSLGEYLHRRLQPGDCFIDIGANIGIHSLRAARRVGPTGLVIAFEPQQRLLEMLERSIAANVMLDWVHARRMAIGASAGTAQLGKFANLTGSATLTENSMIVEREEVPLAPLDAALSLVQESLNRAVEPDVIKIDVEGFEFHVWEGMKAWARSRKRLTIVIEFSPVSYRDMGEDPAELLRQFEEHGFTVSQLREHGQTVLCTPADLKQMAAAKRQYDLVLGK